MKYTVYTDIKHMADEKRDEARARLDIERMRHGFQACIRDLKDSKYDAVGRACINGVRHH